MVSREQILTESLMLAKRSGWERLTLHEVAAALNIPLLEIYRYFPQKDDLVEAWFDRADQALLARVPNEQWQATNGAQRIEQALLDWLEAMVEYRELTGQMLLYKLEPGHIHLQLGGVLRISRTVQWLREAAGLRATHGRRIAQEVALSGVFVSTFIHWLRDGSEGQQQTRSMLRRKLQAGEQLGLWR